MTDTTKTETKWTRADELRRIAGLSTRRLSAARDAFDAYADDVASLRDAADAVDGADLPGMAGQVETLADVLRPLAELGLIEDQTVTELETTAGWFGTLAEHDKLIGLASIGEAYDDLESALDTFEELKEQERYDGKTDDMESAWQEVVSAMELLADAAEDLDLP